MNQNIGSGQTGAVPKQNEIPAAVTQIGITLNNLFASIEALEKKLSPVIVPYPISPAAGLGDPKNQTEIGKTLEVYNSQIQGSANRLASLRESVAL